MRINISAALPKKRNYFAIGDVQGCYKTLRALIKKLKDKDAHSFDEQKDGIILLGDLVNRGPKSLECLQFAFENQSHISMVLGNHDLLLIALYLGFEPEKEKKDLSRILNHPEIDTWMTWYRSHPLIRKYDEYLFVHAGIWPEWNVKQATHRARKAEELIQSPEYLNAFKKRSRSADSYVHCRSKKEKNLFTLRCLTTMRYLDRETHLLAEAASTPPSKAGPRLKAWHRWKSPIKETVVYGHWAAQGLSMEKRHIGLDSGCVWGRSLSALSLKDQSITSIANCE